MTSDSAPAAQKLTSQLLRDDPELRDIVQEFVAGLDGRLNQLREAYQQLDWDALTTLAHRLKGAGGSYGYPDISRICAEMEQRFKAHQGEDFAARLAELERVVGAARSGLE